jgi:hypothetical protein
LVQGGGDGDREAMREQMTRLRKRTAKKIAAVLTDEQRTWWKELTGPPFTFPTDPPDRTGA